MSTNIPPDQPPVIAPMTTPPVPQVATDPVSPVPPSRSRPRTSTVVLSVVLAVVVLVSSAGFFWVLTRLDDAHGELIDQQQRITDQQRQIDEQRELIERKEQFGAAVQNLYDTAEPLVGLPYSTLVPWSRVEDVVERAWEHRWDGAKLQSDTGDISSLAADLASRTEAARTRAASNATGTAWEATLDRLGGGWVSTTFADIAADCGDDALACVADTDPFEVRVGNPTQSDPTMTDWIRTGVAYHEYAHVLQFTNPEATDRAVAAFGGDVETMADCYSLTFLDGWSLEHEVPIDDLSYWEVTIGYGHTCDAGQKQVIRDWVAGLGITKRSLGG